MAEWPSNAAPVTVHLTRALAGLFDGVPAEISSHAGTVDDLMAELDRRWPGMRDRLVDSTPAVRKHIAVFVDGRRATLATPIAAGATVYVLTAISGG